MLLDFIDGYYIKYQNNNVSNKQEMFLDEILADFLLPDVLDVSLVDLANIQ